MARRRAPSASTPKLVLVGLLMLGLGLGLGWLLSQGTHRRGRLPGEERPAPVQPTPGHAAKPAPVGPEKPARPAPAQPEPRRGPVAEAKPSGLPRFALIIDDLGYAPPELVTRLCAQSVPFDVAVLPYLEFSHQSAEIAHGRDKEVMLHLPMEPDGYPAPGHDPGRDAILFDLDEAQIRQRVRQALADIPFHKGVNNHMGSRVTPDRPRMTWVLEELKSAGCFFIDSRTNVHSVGYQVARELGVPTAKREVFLDDDKDPAAVRKQWDRAIALARKNGQVVAIGHIYPETVAILEQLIPAAEGQVQFVKASEAAR